MTVVRQSLEGLMLVGSPKLMADVNDLVSFQRLASGLLIFLQHLPHNCCDWAYIFANGDKAELA